MSLLLVSILLPLSIILVMVSVYFFITVHFKNLKSVTKGTKIFKFDYKSNRVFLYDEKWNAKLERLIFGTNRYGTWISFNFMFKNFIPFGFSKEIAAAIIKIKSDGNLKTFSESIKLKGKKFILINVEIAPIQGSSHYNLVIKWKVIRKNKRTKKIIGHLIPVTTRDFIIGSSEKYSGFIAFGINRMVENSSKLFLADINRRIRNIDGAYFIVQDMLIVYISSNTAKTIKNKIEKTRRKLSRAVKTMGIKRLYYGSAVLVSSDITSSKRLNVVLAAIDFNINLSVRKGIEFMSNESSDFEDEEYDVFVDSASAFRAAIKAQDIGFDEVPIRRDASDRKIMSYALPYVNGVTPGMQKIILRSKVNHSILRNCFSKYVAIDQKIDKPLLVDVDQTWLEKNYKLIKYKKAIYVVSVTSNNRSIPREMVTHLGDNGIIVALKLNRYTESTSTLISKLKPKFIVVGETLTNSTTSGSLISLISIKRSAMINGVKLIHENPSEKIDENMRIKIGIRYSYSLKE